MLNNRRLLCANTNIYVYVYINTYLVLIFIAVNMYVYNKANEVSSDELFSPITILGQGLHECKNFFLLQFYKILYMYVRLITLLCTPQMIALCDD